MSAAACPTCGAPMLHVEGETFCSHLYSHALPRAVRDVAVSRVLVAIRAYRLAVEACAALLCPPDVASDDATYADLVRADEVENAAHDELLAADVELAKLDTPAVPT